MPIEITPKERYGIEDLLNIMQLLRSPQGCQWDREQTHQSIRSNLLEEAHEVIEAINKEDPALLCEELGDLLLQIVFHAQMEQEINSFSFGDVVDGICKKLIIRHPHVFSGVKVNNSEEILENWDKIKRDTKGTKSQADLLRSVPKSLPALMRSAKIQGRAARVGFDWPDVSGALQALKSEVMELEKAIENGDPRQIEDELGDVLFSAVNVSRFVDCDAEQSLSNSCEKFIGRFAKVETLAEKNGIDMTKADIQELDKLWDMAKSIHVSSPDGEGNH
ncbi:MAG TPA: nucleoside triphosphate pyrophosphohydrolase [Clostridiales bacterium]|nr:nucleoside triphosphate pyrophosphohydrolase [Clostridiales bacterium]